MRPKLLHNLGWSLIPVKSGSKEPSVKWKKHQLARATTEQLRQWFDNESRNVAVVLGKVSGRLLCMDFDNAKAYRAWKKKYPRYASTLPTVRTSRGYHVYFRSKHSIKIRYVKDRNGNHLGELRGEGACAVLPPSIHPDGTRYRWLRRPTSKNLLVLDPIKVGFLPNDSSGYDTERTEENRENGRGKKKKEVELTLEIEAIVSKTIPHKQGTRHHSIFNLARELKSLESLRDVDPRHLRPVFRFWFERAKPHIKTKSFSYSWGEFIDAWNRIRTPIGESSAEIAFQKAKTLPPPEIAENYYPDDEKAHLLLTLCRELQRVSGNGPFFLSCRKAGEFLNCSHRTAWRILGTFVKDNLLRETSKGTNTKASRFRYLLPLED